MRQAEGFDTVSFGTLPEALLGGGTVPMSWVNLTTGATRYAGPNLGSFTAFGAVPNTSRFYSSRLRDPSLSSHADAAAGTDLGLDLTIYPASSTLSPACGAALHVSDSGDNLVLDCARVFGLSANKGDDLLYRGGFEQTETINDVAYSASTHRFFVLPELLVEYSNNFPQGTGWLSVYDDQLLNLRAVVDLGTSRGGMGNYAKRVFLGQTDDHIYVWAEDTKGPNSQVILGLAVQGL